MNARKETQWACRLAELSYMGRAWSRMDAMAISVI